jgi:hypothetical protein
VSLPAVTSLVGAVHDAAPDVPASPTPL